MIDDELDTDSIIRFRSTISLRVIYTGFINLCLPNGKQRVYIVLKDVDNQLKWKILLSTSKGI